MPDVSYLVEMITGVPVVTPPAEIDLTTADRFRLVLLEAADHGHTTVVVDMTHTKFCDSAGLSVMARAHKRALEDGGELRLVMPGGRRRVPRLHLDQPAPLHPLFWQPPRGPPAKTRCCCPDPAIAPAFLPWARQPCAPVRQPGQGSAGRWLSQPWLRARMKTARALCCPLRLRHRSRPENPAR